MTNEQIDALVLRHFGGENKALYQAGEDVSVHPDVLRNMVRSLLAASDRPSVANMDAAWEAYQSTPIDLADDSDEQMRKAVENAVRAALDHPSDPGATIPTK